MTIARVALPVAVDRLFDYWIPAGLDVACGAIVRVPLARLRATGVVLGTAQESDVRREDLLAIAEVVDATALPQDVLELVEFVAGYYQSALGLACALALPPLERAVPARDDAPLRLTASGREALAGALRRAPAQRVLHERLAVDGATFSADEACALGPALRRVLARWREAPSPCPIGGGYGQAPREC